MGYSPSLMRMVLVRTAYEPLAASVPYVPFGIRPCPLAFCHCGGLTDLIGVFGRSILSDNRHFLGKFRYLLFEPTEYG